MPGVACNYGNVTRLDLPTPFFLRQDPFNLAGLGQQAIHNYSWNPSQSQKLTILVKKRNTGPPALPTANGEEVANVDVGGCPLECPFDPNENFDDAINIAKSEQVFSGLEFPLDLYDCLDMDSCQDLLKKIYEQDPEALHSLGLGDPGGKQNLVNPIYLACNGSPNARDLVLLGFDDDKFLELRMMGPYKNSSQFLDMNLFLAYHQHLPHVMQGVVRKQVHAVYEKIHGDYAAHGKVFLEFVWPEPETVFEPPPAGSARCKSAIQPKPGDANPLLKKFWSEIQALDTLLQMREFHQGRELNKTCHNMTLEGPNKIMDEIKTLMTLPSIPFWDKDTEFSSSIETVLQRVLNADRSDVDFTDKAWAILKNTDSIVEIYECFKHLLESIEDRKYRPYLFPSNETVFSTLLKDILTEKIKNFRTMFTPAMALDITIDCGIHKLFRDYSFVLKMCNLAQPTDLYCFAPKPGLFRQSLESLKKLHCTFEVLCLSKERLALNMTEQETHAQIVLEYFENHALDWNHTFHFAVPMAIVEPIINGMTPIYWNLKLESSTSLRVSQTNAILSRDFFIAHAHKLFVTTDRVVPRGFYLYVHRVAQRKI